MNFLGDDVGRIFLEMVATFFAAVFVVRVMGNRAVGQMSPFDFVIMVGIGDVLANVAMDREQTIWHGLEALLALLVLQQVVAYLALKNTTLRKWFEGTPVTLIENGRILKDNLVKTQFNFDDLRQELHKQGMDFANLQDIKLARIESCGDFSLVRQPQAEPLTRDDLTNFFTDMYHNPLSPLGRQVVRLDKVLQDLEQVLPYLRQQMSAKPDSPPLKSDDVGTKTLQ